MLESKNLAAKMWAKAMHDVEYIKNIVPHSSLKWNTPFKSYFGHRPDVLNVEIQACSRLISLTAINN